MTSIATSVERAAEIRLETEILPTWYDVDDGATLNRLCDELFAAENQRSNVEGSQNGKNSEGVEVGYAAPFTREYLARLMAVEGRERIWPGATTRAGADG